MTRRTAFSLGGGLLAPFRTSLLPKILAAFLGILGVSALVTFVVETRLIRSELQAQSRRLLEDDLRILRSAFTGQQSELVTSLRNAGQRLSLRRLLAPPGTAELLGELGRLQRELGLDVLGVVDPRDGIVASVGTPLEAVPRSAAEGLAAGSSVRLVATADGRYAHTVSVPFGTLERRVALLGGRLFDDAAAYRLRARVGDDVLLLADGRLVGHTLSDTTGLDRLVATGPDSSGEARVVTVEGRDTFVRYAPLTAPGPWSVAGAAGLAVQDPVAGLDRSLTRARLLAVALMAGLTLLLGWVVFRRLARPLRDLAGTARRIAGGDLEAAFTTPTRDEIGVLADSLEEMRRGLRRHLRVIASQAAALRDSARRIVSAQDEARRRLAGDLHDGLQRRLVMLRIRMAQSRHSGGAAGQPPGALDDLTAEIDALITQLRETSQVLYPSILKDRGLEGALHSLASRSPVALEVTTRPRPLPRLNQSLEANAYFLVSEAVANALKHAEAERIAVDADLDRDRLRVRVVDDGRGLNVARLRSSGGLTHMRDRATAAGGRLRIASAPGEGTEVQATFPLPGSAPDALEVEEDGGHPPVEVEVLAEPQAGEDGADVLLDGPLGDGEGGGDTRVALSGGHLGQHLDLPRGQPRQS